MAGYTARYGLLGIGVALETNSKGLLQTFEAAFGRYGAADEATAQMTLRLLVDEAFTALPPWPPAVVRADHDQLYIAAGNENVVVADLARRHAFGFLSPAMAADHTVLRTSFLECAVFAMATHGTGATHTYVHASAVGDGERGLLFSGPSQSGKSTLAYACARRGFRVVTDDVVYLRTESGSLTAWGRPWRLRFLHDSVRFFPELNRNELFTPENEIEIDVEQFLPGRTQMCCTPSVLFFLHRSGGPARIEPVSCDRAVQLLARDLIADMPGVMDRHRHAWRMLAEKGSYLLHYGEDLEAAVNLVERFHRGIS